MFLLMSVWNWLPVHKWDGADDPPARPSASGPLLSSEPLGDLGQPSLTEQPVTDESRSILLNLQAERNALLARHEEVSHQLNLTLSQLNCVQDELEKCHSRLIIATQLAEAQHHQIYRASELIATLLSDILPEPLVERVQVEVLPPIEDLRVEQRQMGYFVGLARIIGAIRASLRRST